MRYTQQEIEKIASEFPDGIACFEPIYTDAPEEMVDRTKSKGFQATYPDGKKPLATSIQLDIVTESITTGKRGVERGDSYNVVIYPEGARTDLTPGSKLSDDLTPEKVLRLALASPQLDRTFRLVKPDESLLEAIRFSKTPEGRAQLREREAMMSAGFDAGKEIISLDKAAKAAKKAPKRQTTEVEEEDAVDAPPSPPMPKRISEMRKAPIEA